MISSMISRNSSRLVLRFLALYSTSLMVCCFILMHRLCLIPLLYQLLMLVHITI